MPQNKMPSNFNIITLVAFLSRITQIVYSFNMEEMKYVNYDVDISVIPVKREEINQPVIHLTSKSGQEFQCILPQLNEDEISEKEVITEKNEDVIELLNPIKSGPCLSKSKDWWTYEFCFGHYIKQFHIEDGQIIGQVLTLGLYESDYDWNNETNQEKFKHAKQRYHSQYYTNGTKCDLTGQPRYAEVRIYCEQDAGDYIFRVDEPGTCNYVITVHTSRLCSHPLLKPLPSNKAHSIPCHPVLSDEQYSSYQKKLKEQKVLEEERRSKWLSNQQERLEELKSMNLLQTEEIDLSEKKNLFISKPIKTPSEKILMIMIDEFKREMEKLKKLYSSQEKFESFKDDLQQELDIILKKADEVVSSKLDEALKDVSFYRLASDVSKLSRMAQDAELDLMKSIDAFKKEFRSPEDPPPVEKNVVSSNAEQTPSESILVEQVNEFDQRIEKLQKLYATHEKFETFKNAIQNEITTIINKANEVVTSDIDDNLKDESFFDLASQVSMLNKVLKEAETDLLKAMKTIKMDFGMSDSKRLEEEKKNILFTENQKHLQELLELLQVEKDAPTKKSFSKTSRTESEAILLSRIRDFHRGVEMVKKLLPAGKFKLFKNDIQKEIDAIFNKVNEMFSSSRIEKESDLELLLKKLVSELHSLNKVLEEAETDFEKASETLKKFGKSEKIKFDSEQSETAVLDDDKLQVRIRRLERKSSDTTGKLHEMDFEQREKLEQAVKEKLEKSGLDTGGRRIEVKIITAGYYDNEEGKDFQSLTDEETDQFQNMIMALLTGQQEAVTEMRRHKKLEENYQFNWDEAEEMDNKED